MEKSLTYNIKGSILMRNDKMFRTTIDPAYQWDAGLVEEILLHCQGCLGSCSPVSGLQATGVSVCSTGQARETDVADSREEGCLYGQTSFEFGSSTKATNQIEERIFKCFCHNGHRNVSRERGAWLRKSLVNKFKGLIVLIGWLPKNLFMPISS